MREIMQTVKRWWGYPGTTYLLVLAVLVIVASIFHFLFYIGVGLSVIGGILIVVGNLTHLDENPKEKCARVLTGTVLGGIGFVFGLCLICISYII